MKKKKSKNAVKKTAKRKPVNTNRTKDENCGCKTQPASKYWFVLFFLAVLILAIMVIKPFLSVLIVGGVLAYVLHPLYRLLLKRVKYRGAAAGIIIFLLVLVFTVPFVFITTHAVQESYDVYLKAKTVVDGQSIEEFCTTSDGMMCEMYSSIIKFSEERGIIIGDYIAEGMGSVVTKLIKAVSGYILNIPSILLYAFISLFIIFYMLVDGERIVQSIKRALPLRETHKENITKKFTDMVYATIHGAIIIAIIQGALALIGYLIFDAPSPILLGLVTTVLSVVPFIGTGIVWMPTSLIMIFTGISNVDNSLTMKGIGLLIYGIVIISTIDNIIRPKIVGDRAKVHPLIILLGVFGGLAVFGITGIIIGPLILTLFITALKIYEEEKENIID